MRHGKSGLWTLMSVPLRGYAYGSFYRVACGHGPRDLVGEHGPARLLRARRSPLADVPLPIQVIDANTTWHGWSDGETWCI